MTTLTLEDTVTREIGKAGMFTIGLSMMPDASLQYIFAYGLKQVLADAHSAAKTPDEAKALTEKKLAALLSGEIRATSGRTSDPVLAEAKRLARAALAKALKAQGKDIKNVEAGDVTNVVAKLAPKYMDEAKAIVERAAEAAKGLDLGSLGL